MTNNNKINNKVNNNKVITMTAWRRPGYTRQVLDNLLNCIGFNEYTLLANIEPGYTDVQNLFKDVPNCEVVVNDRRLGCAANTLKALQRGFDISDFVIHMEDDTVPGIDSLKYFEYINNRYKDDKESFSATAYNRITKIDPQKYFSVHRCHYFTGWMWGTWRDRFEEMEKNWDFTAWDININKKIRGKRYEICPNLPRSQNIGELLGTYTTPYNWNKCQYSTIWVNSATDISGILSSTILPSNLSSHINDLSYFEIFSSSCLPECYDPGIGIIGIIGISFLYLFYNQRKKKNRYIDNDHINDHNREATNRNQEKITYGQLVHTRRNKI